MNKNDNNAISISPSEANTLKRLTNGFFISGETIFDDLWFSRTRAEMIIDLLNDWLINNKSGEGK